MFKYFILAFCCSFFTGLFNNYSKHNDRDFIEHQAFKYIVPKNKGEIYELHFESTNGHIYYTYDIDTNELIPTSDYLTVKDADVADWNKYAFPVNTSVMSAAFGGVSGAWTVKDMYEAYTKAKSSKFKKLILTAVGAISGYSLGDYLGGKLYSPFSSESLEVLNNKKYWKKIESAIWVSIWIESNKLAMSFQEDKYSKFANSIRKLHAKTKKRLYYVHDFTASDFKELYFMTKHTKRFISEFRQKLDTKIEPIKKINKDT